MNAKAPRMEACVFGLRPSIKTTHDAAAKTEMTEAATTRIPLIAGSVLMLSHISRRDQFAQVFSHRAEHRLSRKKGIGLAC